MILKLKTGSKRHYLFGTAREIRSLYKTLEAKTLMIPLFVNDPVLVNGRMHGIHVEAGGFYTVVNADTCLATIIDLESVKE